MITDTIPQPRYEARFNPQHFEPSTNSGGKSIGFQEVWRELPGNWWLCAHLVKDEDGVFVRKAFARRGLRPDGTWEQSIAVGTYDVVAIEDAAAEKSAPPKVEESAAQTGGVTAQYLENQYGWVARKGLQK